MKYVSGLCCSLPATMKRMWKHCLNLVVVALVVVVEVVMVNQDPEIHHYFQVCRTQLPRPKTPIPPLLPSPTPTYQTFITTITITPTISAAYISLHSFFLFFWAISRPNFAQIQQPWSFLGARAPLGIARVKNKNKNRTKKFKIAITCSLLLLLAP